MKRLCLVLLSVMCCAGCLNSRAFGQLMLPRMTFQTPVAWDCAQRVPHPQGQVRLDGTPVMCERCANRSDLVQSATVADSPYQVPPGAAFYRCENSQVLADPQVMSYATTTPR